VSLIFIKLIIWILSIYFFLQLYTFFFFFELNIKKKKINSNLKVILMHILIIKSEGYKYSANSLKYKINRILEKFCF